MAGNARYTALLDACVLYPIAITDSLLSLATAKLFAAKWTTRIEQEWITALERDRPDLQGKLAIRRDSMRAAVPDWEVPQAAWERLVGCITLPDKNDARVLAAAIAGHADCIVTSNERHFPLEIVAPYGLEIVDPDTFITNQLDLSQIVALGAFKRMRARRKKPESSPEEFADAIDEEARRLADVIANGVESRIPGLQLRAVPVAGGHVFIIRAGQSWAGPHRVKTNQHFFVREGARRRQLDMPEIRCF